ncbi:MAG: hypothetical protein JXD23_17930 [Spirochaetales bacterium]|nr:hypothetical protein [Spirochaetales bacterium]
MTHKTALYPGDGIGPEVINEAEKVLRRLPVKIDFTRIGWNAGLYKTTGRRQSQDARPRREKHDRPGGGRYGGQALAGPLLP